MDCERRRTRKMRSACTLDRDAIAVDMHCIRHVEPATRDARAVAHPIGLHAKPDAPSLRTRGASTVKSARSCFVGGCECAAPDRRPPSPPR
jgi:hypothetical protein